MYKKRDIVLVPVPFSDNKNRKVGPALVISNEAVHSTGDIVIVQITSKNKRDSLSIEIDDKDITKQLPIKEFYSLS
jgi:mRNA interferase MazF